eukprot:TRINITY_DN14388_c0_g3_i1.p1 TRINITY_DN14388_c0_g3~~TRINITY_DN14388_c0_g3_i1.p1  ORF type:complete len:842 (+),score=68.24 TRINITY_DN14388_c0_g3_i1:328-2526(+)
MYPEDGETLDGLGGHNAWEQHRHRASPRSSAAAYTSAALRADAANHPAESEEQRRWELKYRRASVVKEIRYMGERIILHDFKGGWQFETNYAGIAQGGRDPYELERRPRLEAGEVALDVGANLGLISILLAKKAHSKARIFALEPHPALYRYLLWNLRANNVTEIVWPLRIGGCDPLRSGSRAHVSFWPWWEPASATRVFQSLAPREALRTLSFRRHAPCTSLKNLMMSLKVSRVAFLKLDCEGCEWSFAGSDNGAFLIQALRDGRIGVIVGELHHARRFMGRGRATVLRALCTSGGISKGQGSCNKALERCDKFFSACQVDPNGFQIHAIAKAIHPQARRQSRPRRPRRRFLGNGTFVRASSNSVLAKISAKVRSLRVAPTASRAALVVRILESWQPASVAQANWAVTLSGKLDDAWWQRAAKGKLTPAQRRLLARVSGALLARTSLSLHCSYEPSCLSHIGSRAMELLRRAGAHHAAEHLFRILSPRVPWVSSWQTPHRYMRSLRARPFWNDEDLRAEGLSAVADIAEAMRSNYPKILEDLERIRSERWPPAYGPELIHSPMNWTKMLLYDGDLRSKAPYGFPDQPYQNRELHAGLCEVYAPNTCSMLKDLLPGLRRKDLPYIQPDHEQVAFFHLAPGSQIEFHHASSNARLAMHLCLSGCGGSSRLQVGPYKRGWKEGEVIVFDDSFLHRVNIDPTLDRWILHVFAVHPGVDVPERFNEALADARMWPY